jgi:uncharacterized protein (TIGR02246 family)
VEPDALLDALLDAFNARDADAVAALMHPDGVWEETEGPPPSGRVHHGRDAVRRAADRLFRLLPDGRFEDADRFVAGDRALLEWTYRATPPSGEALHARGCDVLTFRDGLVLRKASYLTQTRGR